VPVHRVHATVSPPVAAPQPSVIDRFVSSIPTPLVIALAAAVLLAVLSVLAALWSGLLARRRADEIEEVSAAALTDPLTGVLNRRGFTEAVERELDRARRHDQSFAIAYVDIRGLKAVNDTEGHLAGDELLRQAASVLRDSARAHDVVGRLGGDELGVLLVDQSDGAEPVIRRVRDEVEARRQTIGLRSDWDLTIGTSNFPDDGESFDELIDAADRRLYEQRGIALR
jgi:diguanylate cyclase (GGDEF)-like protein